jgi:hypothetical protein
MEMTQGGGKTAENPNLGKSYTYTDQGAHDSSGVRRENQYGCTAEQRATMAELGLTLETAPKDMRGINEWEDALIKHKVMDPRLDHKKMAFMKEMKHEDEAVLNPKDECEDLDLDALLEAEDDLDERMFQKYREQRMGELLEKQQKERFGEVVHVKQDEYVREITEASQGETVVFVHLYQDSIPECKRLNMVMAELAYRQRAVKFTKIRATDANAEYPDSALPTLLVYRGGQVVDRMVAFKTHGGDPFTADGLEWNFAQKGYMETELEEDPFARLTMHRLQKKHDKGKRSCIGYDSSDSDE